ncbi:uncharacterized protein EV154DRAFT_552771 [Mucor mucedo]|uniref:uncharacterized protein n=1 Tax=Mucor mucedo TaxID=29922 RepID=UPI00221E9D4B|nr:uncharacterized protein EV154DRAFT_552771 [Mucor mucedo]KAI7889767.1 hypothetical protein EV154DRAFT_552771 [Mucor mucedo]
MQLKFLSLGLIASILASASARSVYTENSVGAQNMVAEASNSHLVARCNNGCCSSSCGGGSPHKGGDGFFDDDFLDEGEGKNTHTGISGGSGDDDALINVSGNNVQADKTLSNILNGATVADNLNNADVDVASGGGHGGHGGNGGNGGGSGSSHCARSVVTRRGVADVKGNNVQTYNTGSNIGNRARVTNNLNGVVAKVLGRRSLANVSGNNVQTKDTASNILNCLTVEDNLNGLIAHVL